MPGLSGDGQGHSQGGHAEGRVVKEDASGRQALHMIPRLTALQLCQQRITIQDNMTTTVWVSGYHLIGRIQTWVSNVSLTALENRMPVVVKPRTGSLEALQLWR